MTQFSIERNVSLAFQNLSITSNKNCDDWFESIIKSFQPKVLFDIDKIKYRKRKRPNLTAIHKQIKGIDNKIIDGDVRELVLNEFLKQYVISNHKSSKGFDLFFQNPETASLYDSAGKRKSLE